MIGEAHKAQNQCKINNSHGVKGNKTRKKDTKCRASTNNESKINIDIHAFDGATAHTLSSHLTEILKNHDLKL